MSTPFPPAPPPEVAALKRPEVPLPSVPEESEKVEKATQETPDRKGLERQMETLNKLMKGLGHRLEFGLYEGTDQLFVKLVDRRSNQVVKILPPEELLELSKRIAEAVGVILDRVG